MKKFGPWRSLVARLLGVQEVVSSNLAGPTKTIPSPCQGVTGHFLRRISPYFKVLT